MQFSDIKEKLTVIKKKLRPILSKVRMFWFPLILCYFELVIHYFAYRSFGLSTMWILLFSCGLGFFISFLTSIFPRRVNSFLTYFFTFIFTLLFEVQTVYFEIFKGFAPVSSVKLGAQAVTNFAGSMIEGILSCIAWMILIFLPFLFLCIFSIWLRPKFNRPARIIKRFIPIIASVVILVGTVGTMAVFFSGTPSVYATFSSFETSTDSSVNYFGLNTTMIQEFRWLLFPDSSRITAESLSDREYEEGDQVDPLVDFDALYEKADDEVLKNLTAELSNMPITQKNKYTGLCEGYNLITICAEAFSPVFIDEKLTPTLYKLTNNGFVFDNFYATFPNTTTNGEYAFLMGLFPDLSRGKTDSSFGLSASNYLPYCYGNLFTKEGADAFAYHNYVGEFYYRNQTHPNMGYEFKSANSGIDIKMTSPTSDYDMMVETVKDYADSGKRFVAYYMTYSGHYPYGESNAMCAKNLDIVKDLPLSDTAKAYVSCNLELEYALTHLLETLETSGIADKTMIVLTTDHYPYGLTDDEYAELAARQGREINDVFDKQKNSFICYIPNMDPIHVEEYCSTVDILPTILNLFGFTYDSRLLAGQDVLDSNAEHVAILADGSFIADGVSFDASLIEYKYDNKTDEAVALGEKLYKSVQKRFRISTDILNNNYYSFVYDEKSHSAAIDNLTSQYTDVEIMTQSPVYYVLKNDIMDPSSETLFGIYDKCTVITVIDSLYRIAGRPEVDADAINAPFTVSDEYRDAVAWAYCNDILKNDGKIMDALNETIKLGQYTLLLERTAKYFELDTSVDRNVLKNITARYKFIDEEIIHASLYCRDNNIIIGDGNENYVFYTSTASLSKSFVADSLYRICSYYIMPENK